MSPFSGKAYSAVPIFFDIIICFKRPTVDSVLDDNGVPPCDRSGIANINYVHGEEELPRGVHHLPLETRRVA